MLTKENNAVKKTFKNNSDTPFKMHTLYTFIYVNALDFSQNKKQSFLLAFSNLDVYFIIHVYKII